MMVSEVLKVIDDLDVIRIYDELREHMFHYMGVRRAQDILSEVVFMFSKMFNKERDEGVRELIKIAYDRIRQDNVSLLGREQELVNIIYNLERSLVENLEKILMMRLRPFNVFYRAIDADVMDELKEKVYWPTIIIQITREDRFWLKLPEKVISDPDTGRFLYKQPEQVITVILNRVGGENQ